MAAPTRQLVDAERIEAAIGAEDDEAVGRLGGNEEARPVAFLVLDLAGGHIVALYRADPAFRRAKHGDGLALDQRLDGNEERRRGVGDLGAAATQRRLGAELLSRLGDLLGD